MVGRTYPSNQSNNADPNDSNNKDSEDDDESIILEWEDDRGRDIRHLFSNHPLPTMTQQIDAAMDSSSCSSYSGDENDGCGDEGLDGGEPEEDRKDGYADGQGGPRERKLQRDDHSDNTNHDNATRRSPRLRKKQTQKSEMSERAARTDSNIDAKSATNSASTNLDPVNINNRKKHEGESGGDRTPPPSKSSLKKRQLGSGEAPATISKVVRRRKSKSENHSRSNPTSRKVTISPLFTTATEGKGDKKNERKFAKESKENNAAKNENAGHEVDRVFDFLGLDGTSAATAENYQTFNNDSLAEDCDAKEHSLEEMQQHERERYMQHLQQHHKQRLQPPVNVHLLNSLDIEECDIREVMESGENVDSPLGSRRLQFEHDATAAGSEGGDKSNLRGCRGVIKLPPLHPLMNNFDAKQRETKQIGVSSNNKIHSDFSASGASAEISEKGKTLRQRRQRTTDETSTDIGGQKDENDDDDDGESIWKEIERGLDKKVDSNDVNNDSRNDRNVLCSTTSVPGAMASVIEPKYVVIARTNGNFTTNDANTSSNTTHAVSRSSSSMGASSDHADYKKTATRNDRGFCNQNIERPHPSHPSFSRNISTLSSFSGSNHFSVKSSSATSIPPKDQSTVEIRTNGISSKTGEAGANIESIGTDTCVSNKSNRQGNVSATISSSISSIFQIPSKNVDTSHKFDTKDGIHSTISASVETNKIHSTKKTDTVNSNVTINTVSSKKFVIGNVDAVSNNIYNNEIGNSHLISNRSNTMKTNHKANNTDEFDDFDFEVDDQDLAKMDAQVSSLTQQRNSMDPREAAAISRMVPPPSLGVGGLNGNNSIANHRALKPVIPNFSAVDPRSSSGNIQNCLNSDTAARTDANALNFDDDDDDWGAEDLAKIDLKVSMTQSAFAPLSRINSASSSNNMNVNGDRTINTNASNYNPEQGPSGSSINKNQSSHEFSDDDDDFADVDFAALDDKIVQHQQMTQAMDGNHRTPPPMQHLPPPPPPHAPIYNRRVATNSAKTTLSDGSGPSYLKFSRYVIRSVQVDVKTFTKTIAVVTWTSKDEIGDRQESERLRKICEENNGRYFDNPLNAIEIDGCLHLRGEWYHTQCHVGDVIHLCSLSGTYATDKSALPVVLHSNPPEGSDMHDDLLLVVHPDVLISPTLVSEAVKCPRLSVLQSRLGSTGLSAKSAVIGTLRHDLFERCLQERDVSRRSAVLFIRQIIRDRAETLLGCGITKQSEAFAEVMKTVPQIQKFHATYTSWSTNDKIDSSGSDRNRVPKAVLDGMYTSANTLVSIEDVHSTEEWAMVPELGLKGIVDATVMARTKPVNGLGSLSSNSGVQQSLMPVELKTGHVQNPQQLHLAQLSLYTLMLRARHGTSRRGNSLEVIGKSDVGDRTSNSDEQESGAADGGMLLYLNHEAFLARHVKPMINEAKTLIGQRNSVVCDLMKASRPRGIKIQYEDDDGNNDTAIKRKFKITVDSPPPSNLPPILPSINTCERCYKNRECMMYSSTDAQHLRSSALSSVNVLTSTHKKLIDHFTGHLSDEDFEYFRTWDRLIDLEKHASSIEVAKSWLFDSAERESKDGKCIGGLVIDVASFSASLNDGGNKLENNENTILRFRRSRNHSLQTSLLSLSFEPSSYVIISTDGTSFTSQTQWKDQFSRRKRIRHKMHLLRATVDRVMENCIDVIVARKEISLIKRLFRSGASNEVFLRPVDFVNGEEMLFRLDKDESYNGAGLLLQNLVNFFTLDIPPFSAESYGQTPAKMKSLTSGSQSSSRRRRMNRFIVKLSPEPRFRRVSEETLFSSPSFLHGIPGCTMDTLERDFNLLNSDQKNAVLKVVSAEDFALIQGLPGTGKTATIAFLTRLLVALGKRVLLTSYTHSAVDNLIIKLIESKVVSSGTSPIPILRIGRESSCHPRVHSILAQNIAISQEKLSSRSTDNAENPSVDYLHMVVSDAKIVGVSALSAPKSPLLAGQHFDYVIVDEAGQISQPAVLGAIMAADSFVLVGDHMQLPPLVCSEVAEEAGYGVSMLMRLAEGFPDAVAKLTIQYRMHEDICRLSNTIAYQGLLKCGNKNIQHGKLQLSNYPPDSSLLNLIDKKWIKRAINPDEPVVFLDTDGECSSRHGPRFSNFVGLESDGPTNEFEISIVRNIIQALTLSGLNASSIGIITPFRSQLRLLNDDLYINQCKNDGLELSTIDRFQGRDKPAILFSLVRSNSEGKSGKILQDFRRLNVAFSRAKHKFVMIGSFSTLKKGNDVIGPILKLVHEEGWIETVGSFKA